MVMDGDVMKKDDFRNAFITWLSESGIKVADTVCIVNTSAIFEKTIPPDPKSRTVDTSGVTAFIESIPFQHVATMKKQMKDGSVKVIVANKDLLSSIYHGLEKSAHNMLGIFPELSSTTDNAIPTQNTDIVEQAKKHLTLYSLKNTQQYIFDIFPHNHKSLTQMSVSEAAQQPVQPWVVVAVVALLIAGGVGVWPCSTKFDKDRLLLQEKEPNFLRSNSQYKLPTQIQQISNQSPPLSLRRQYPHLLLLNQQNCHQRPNCSEFRYSMPARLRSYLMM
jgi:hypothetical protein